MRLDHFRLFAALLIGSTGTLILGLQPVLLGALLSEKRVTFDGLALMATAEMLAVGIGSAAFALLTTASHMRVKAAVLLVATAFGHYVTADAAGTTSLVLIRTLTGLAEGGLIAVAVEAVARTDAPGRNGGWFIVVQTLAQSILAALLALLVVPHWGSYGGFIMLGMVTAVTLGAVLSLNDDYGPLPKPDTAEGGTNSWQKPAVALLTIFALYLFIGAVWAFLEPLGLQSGVDALTVGLIVSISLLVQVGGALSATALEPHIRYPLVIGGAAIAAIVIAIGFATGPALTLFWLLSLATGFLWLFVVPWQINMTVIADPSRKTALLVPAAQLFGAALGPAGAAAFITETNFYPAAWFASVAAALSLAFLIVLVVMSKTGGERT
jgi:MFS transporter, DHA1 family, inner membrane transport protein